MYSRPLPENGPARTLGILLEIGTLVSIRGDIIENNKRNEHINYLPVYILVWVLKRTVSISDGSYEHPILIFWLRFSLLTLFHLKSYSLYLKYG